MCLVNRVGSRNCQGCGAMAERMVALVTSNRSMSVLGTTSAEAFRRYAGGECLFEGRRASCTTSSSTRGAAAGGADASSMVQRLEFLRSRGAHGAVDCREERGGAAALRRCGVLPDDARDDARTGRLRASTLQTTSDLRTHRISLRNLAKEEMRETLKLAWTEPLTLEPQQPQRPDYARHRCPARQSWPSFSRRWRSSFQLEQSPV